MEGFVEGYMKLHTTSNGRRRWSTKASPFENIREEDLEKLRMNMASGLRGEKDKKLPESEPKERKDTKASTPSSTSTISKDNDKETNDTTQQKTTVNVKVERDNNLYSDDKTSKP